MVFKNLKSKSLARLRLAVRMFGWMFMAVSLTLGAAPETLSHSSQYHQSQISFIDKEDGRGFFRLCVDLYPTGFVSYTQHLVCLFSL